MYLYSLNTYVDIQAASKFAARTIPEVEGQPHKTAGSLPVNWWLFVNVSGLLFKGPPQNNLLPEGF